MNVLPNLINLGMVNVSVVMQNAGVFIGITNVSGWDGNQKLNLAQGAMYGQFNWATGNVHYTFDGYEFIDGVIFDQDIKSQIANNF